jgi:molybdate transport system substrate-binding protein
MNARRLILAAVAAASVLLGATACASDASSSATPSASSSVAAPSGDLTIYAAASLRNAFQAVATAFEAEYPQVTVKPIVYDGSSTLATQIVEGAPVDVFASADTKNMTKVTDAKLASSPQNFATNTLVIAVPSANPARIATLADLARPGVSVVLCAPAVPCGSASQTLLKNQGVSVTPVSQEQNVTAVLTKVSSGAADAGLVYATDVRGASGVTAIVPAGADQVVNEYPIAALAGAPNPTAAAAFTAFVTSAAGEQILQSYGFGAP